MKFVVRFGTYLPGDEKQKSNSKKIDQRIEGNVKKNKEEIKKEYEEKWKKDQAELKRKSEI